MSQFVLEDLTAYSALGLYLLAWVWTVGGTWLLFMRAEHSLSSARRDELSVWIRSVDRPGPSTIPDQLAALFDGGLGAHPQSWRCFRASSIASISVTTILVMALSAIWDPGVRAELAKAMACPPGLAVGAIIVLTNTLPDFASVLVTRRVIDSMRERGLTARLLWRDLWHSLAIGVLWSMLILGTVANMFELVLLPRELYVLWWVLALVSMLSTLFPSAWMWSYAGSLALTRSLLRLKPGDGFPLDVADVERQPFRSMGFVSVLIVSGLFLVGLPFVLL